MKFMKKIWIQSDCKISISIHHWSRDGRPESYFKLMVKFINLRWKKKTFIVAHML